MEKQDRSGYRVKVLDIELTNRCNAQCVICPRGELERPIGDMSRETWSTLLSRIKTEHLEGIIFSGFGEPLLHPLLPQYLNQLREVYKGIIQVNTNGARLTKELGRDMIRAEVNILNVSYNGLNKDEYESTMRGMKWDRLVNNIQEMINVRGEGRRPVLSLQSSMPGIRTQRKKIMDVASVLGMETVLLYGFNNRAGYLEDGGEDETTDVIPLVDRFCYPLFFVAWDGTIYPCSHDIKGTQPLGNIEDRSLDEVKKADYPICMRCTICDRKGMKQYKVWKNIFRYKWKNIFHYKLKSIGG
ncbi:radical SAM protein [Thermodesulfobacteriota bacterium]